MSEWWTYEPQDFLMFSPETYYRLFELHNAGLWPLHIAALLAALIILALLARPGAFSGRVISLLLAAGWGLVAWTYFHERYAAINLAAPAYAWLFAAQSLLLLISGLVLDRLHIETSSLRAGGIALFLLGIAAYPMAAALLGRPWMQAEMFGIAPDPTVFATFGILATAARPCWELWIVPVIWSAITALTLWTMGAPEAPLILFAPSLALGIFVYRRAAHARAHSGKVNG